MSHMFFYCITAKRSSFQLTQRLLFLSFGVRSSVRRQDCRVSVLLLLDLPTFLRALLFNILTLVMAMRSFILALMPFLLLLVMTMLGFAWSLLAKFWMLWSPMLLLYFGLYWFSALCLGKVFASTLIQSLQRRQLSQPFLILLGIITTIIQLKLRRNTPSSSNTDPMVGLMLISDPLTDTLNGLDVLSTLCVLVLAVVTHLFLLLVHIFRRQGLELLQDQNVYPLTTAITASSTTSHTTENIQDLLTYLIPYSDMDWVLLLAISAMVIFITQASVLNFLLLMAWTTETLQPYFV